MAEALAPSYKRSRNTTPLTHLWVLILWVMLSIVNTSLSGSGSHNLLFNRVVMLFNALDNEWRGPLPTRAVMIRWISLFWFWTSKFAWTSQVYHSQFRLGFAFAFYVVKLRLINCSNFVSLPWYAVRKLWSPLNREDRTKYK